MGTSGATGTGMDSHEFWSTVRGKSGERRDGAFGGGALRAALLFGMVAIAVAIILTPLLAARSDRQFAERGLPYDTMTTGSIGPRSPARIFTIRRSITQPMPDAICIIDADGHRKGAC